MIRRLAEMRFFVLDGTDGMNAVPTVVDSLMRFRDAKKRDKIE